MAANPCDSASRNDNHGASRDGRQSKRRRIACRHCRQAKIRCEASEGGSKPCKHCQGLGRECVIDLEYKRLNKKPQLSELAEQVEQLRSAATAARSQYQHADLARGLENATKSLSPNAWFQTNSQQSPLKPGCTPASSVINADPTRVDIAEPVLPQQLQLHHVGIESCSVSDKPARTEVRTLDHITLGAEQIDHLFQVYRLHYHAFFPLLEPMPPPNFVYEQSSLLFWTIIVVAARHDQNDLSLKVALNPCVTKLLWLTISTPPHSLRSLQAMSLFCMWPIPTSSMSTDVTFILAGIVKSAALHIGLHRPEDLQDYSRAKHRFEEWELYEAVKVWSGCYIAAESVAVAAGQQAYLSSDPTIERACALANPYRLPQDLRHSLILQKFCSKAHQILSGNDNNLSSDPATGRYTLLRAIEYDLQEQERTIGDAVTLRTQIFCLSTRLQVQTYYLFFDSDSLDRKLGVLRAYETAILLISSIESADVAGNFIRYLPSLLFRTSMVAATLIMKVIHSSYSQSVDTQRGKVAFNTFLSMSRQCSVEDNDLMGRANKILTQLWIVHRSLVQEQEQQPGLTIRSRSFFSVVHDSLWLWRKRFGGQPGNGAPSLPPLWHRPWPTTHAASTGDGTVSGSNLAVVNNDMTGTRLETPQAEEWDQRAFPTISLETDSGYDASDDLNSEEKDWMWSIGFPSLSNMDFNIYPTSLGIGELAPNPI